MRRTTATVGTTLAVFVSLALTACVPSAPHVTPTVEPTATPIFASDEEALAAAKKAYEGYLAASDAIGNDGGKNAERISRWVTAERRTQELAIFREFAMTGERLVGSSKFSNLALQRVGSNKGNSIEVVAYACDDVSGTKLLNSFGRNITPSSRPAVIAVQVTFESSPANRQRLVVGGSAAWSDENYCSLG